MTNLDDHTTQTLVKMCRQLYPHDFLGDMYYAKVVEVLDEQAGADETYKAKIVDGVKGLDDVFKIEFVELSNGYQVQALEAIEGSEFFESVRKDTVKHLYNNPLVWRYFAMRAIGHLGGYINRGFDDISWIPDETKTCGGARRFAFAVVSRRHSHGRRRRMRWRSISNSRSMSIPRRA